MNSISREVRPSSAALREALEEPLRRRFGTGRLIASLERRDSDYRTSHALEELDVTLDDGTRIALVFKQLGEVGLSDVARQAKPQFLREPLRELEVYESVVGADGEWAPTCYASVSQPENGRCWLFLERSTGAELYQVGDSGAWCEVARWLARMHRCLDQKPVPDTVLTHDREHYLRFAERALAFGNAPSTLEPLLRSYGRVVERLLALPVCFIHGEFYASNVLIERDRDPMRVTPVDWEMAAIAPPLFDLAALTSGSWTATDRRAMALAYWTALEPKARHPETLRAFFQALDLCRLHLTVQWLGWSARWTPPQESAHDWGGEAERLVRQLAL